MATLVNSMNSIIDQIQRLNLKIVHKGAILVLVPLVFELIFICVLTGLVQGAEQEIKQQVRSKAIISQSNTLSKSIYDAGVALVGYSVTKSALFDERFNKVVKQIPEDLDELRSIVGENPRQQDVVENIKKITMNGVEMLNQTKSAIDSNRVDIAHFRARHMYKEMRNIADNLQEELKQLTETERKIERESPEKQSRSRTILLVFIFGGVITNIVIALLLLWFFARSVKDRLDVLTDNSYRLAQSQPLNPLVGGNDEISHLDSVFHSMAEALTEATRKERAVIDNAVDVICSIDTDGKFVAVNPACFENWGYTQMEIVGKRFIELIAPQDIGETIKAVRAIRAQEGDLQFENRVRRKDGTETTVSWSAYWSEKEKAMFCVAHDISQRKTAEEAVKASESRIRSIMNHMIVGLVIVDSSGRIESMNPQAEKIFGFTTAELEGRHVLCLFADSKFYSEAKIQDTDTFWQTLSDQAQNKIKEYEGLTKRGDEFPIEVLLSELNTHEGARFIVNVVDVSERKEVERLKKEFVATVSHELRTPLTSIRGSLTLLSVGALGALPEQAQKVVSIAERNTLRLIGLINDILDIEKLESGKLDMVFVNTGLQDILDRSEQAVAAFAQADNISIDIRRSDKIVYADADRIVQVLVNLLSNAIKFSPPGGFVEVFTEETFGFITVKVVDKGRGVPEAFKKLLFQRFQQVEASDSKKKGGTGLGLAICKGIIEQHGGHIGVDSEEGKGSTFWFKIPAMHTDSTLVVNVQEAEAGSGASQ